MNPPMLVSIVLIGLSLTIGFSQTNLPIELSGKIDAFVAERMSQGKLPGLSLVIVKGGQPVYLKGYGFANLEHKTPMTVQTPVAVASNSKGMTALAIMQLVEQGKIKLDARVTTYLPWFKVNDPRGGSITVRQVLTHTAGLPVSAVFDGNRAGEALEQHVRKLSAVKLNRTPGSGFEYANDGYAVAGLIVQVVSGMPFEGYMSKYVFGPMAMQDSSFDPIEAEGHGLAQGYIKQRSVLSPGLLNLSRGQAPAGLALTSARDVALYFSMLLADGRSAGKNIAAKSSLEEIWKPQVQFEREQFYGLGWVIKNVNGLKVINHTGSLTVGSSDFILIPSQKLAVGVMVNLSSRHTVEIAEGIVTLLQGGTPAASRVPPEREPSSFKPDTKVWTKYVGSYDSSEGPIQIFSEGNKLLGRAGDTVFELEAYGDNDFVIRGEVGAFEGYALSFSIGTDNQVTMLLGGQPFARRKL